MPSLSPERVAVFMPVSSCHQFYDVIVKIKWDIKLLYIQYPLLQVGEIYTSEGGEGQENFEPSVRIPLQLSHTLHTLLFSICLEIAKVGPQSIPKNVKDNLRLSLGQSVITFYEQFLKREDGESEGEAAHLITPQMGIQFIFDLKFVQWFHPNLSGSTDSLVLQLKTLIDPFDWDIVSPRLTINLKRFLFENHVS
jgi:hypothetical protein